MKNSVNVLYLDVSFMFEPLDAVLRECQAHFGKDVAQSDLVIGVRIVEGESGNINERREYLEIVRSDRNESANPFAHIYGGNSPIYEDVRYH